MREKLEKVDTLLEILHNKDLTVVYSMVLGQVTVAVAVVVLVN